MDTGNLDPLFVPVTRAFNFARQIALCFCKFVLQLSEKLRIAELFTVGRYQQVRKTKVEPYRVGFLRQKLNMAFTLEADKVPSGGVFGNRERDDLTGQRTRPLDFQRRVHLGKSHSGRLRAVCEFVSVRHIPGALGMRLFLERRELTDALEKSAVRLFEMPQRLLQRHARDFTKPLRFIVPFPTRECLTGCSEPHRFTVSVGVNSHGESAVIDVPDTPKLFSKHLGLLYVWIDSVLIAVQHHAYRIVRVAVNYSGLGLRQFVRSRSPGESVYPTGLKSGVLQLPRPHFSTRKLRVRTLGVRSSLVTALGLVPGRHQPATPSDQVSQASAHILR